MTSAVRTRATDGTDTFVAPGETLAGCHVAGHYAGGMKATITVTE